MSDERARHRRLYRALPEMECEPGCSTCCGPAPLSPWEAARLGVPGAATTPVRPGTATCAFLEHGRCSVYDKRPWACRAYGTGELMPCPRGRAPAAGRLPLKALVRMAKEFRSGCPPEWDEARRRSAHAAVAGGGTLEELTVLERFQRLARESGGHG